MSVFLAWLLILSYSFPTQSKISVSECVGVSSFLSPPRYLLSLSVPLEVSHGRTLCYWPSGVTPHKQNISWWLGMSVWQLDSCSWLIILSHTCLAGTQSTISVPQTLAFSKLPDHYLCSGSSLKIRPVLKKEGGTCNDSDGFWHTIRTIILNTCIFYCVWLHEELDWMYYNLT